MCTTAFLLLLALGGALAWSPGLSPMEIVRRSGYSGQTHRVQTEDGYVLRLHRVAHRDSRPRPVFFLQHGLACSSSMWLAPPRAFSLPFVLADRGFDVWMGNVRGNRYGNEHIQYNTSDPRFWDYSWHEMGIFDMPAMVDYVLNTTGRDRMFILGHSMGGGIITLLLASRPEYNKKIVLAFGYAPAVYVQSMRSTPLKFLCTHYAPYLMSTGPSNWLPNIDNFTKTHWKYCDRRYPTYLLCHVAYRLLAGPSDISVKSLTSVLQAMPTSVSAKTFAHFGQNLHSGKFQPYSYGEKYNYLRYGTKEPPEYNIKNISAPFALLYSDDDYAVHPKNVFRLFKELPNAISLYKVPKYGFNHLDFIFGNHVDYLIREVFRVLEGFKNEIDIYPEDKTRIT